MRKLLAVIVIAALLYSGYWAVGYAALRGGIDDAVTDLRQDGWQVSYTELATRGFPSRFDTTARDLVLQSPDGNIAYTTELAQVFALSYQPTRVIGVLAPEQLLTLNGIPVRIRSDDMRLSAATKASTNLPFEAATLDARALQVAVDDQILIDAERMLAAARATEAEATYDLYLGLTQLELPDDVREEFDPDGTLPAMVEAATFAANVRLDRVLDRHVRGQRPVIEAVDLQGTRIDWGDLSIELSGMLDVSAGGIPSGTVDIAIDGYDTLVSLIEQNVSLPPTQIALIRSAGASVQDDDGVVTLPLTFRDGQVRFGFIPLGPAPRIAF